MLGLGLKMDEFRVEIVKQVKMKLKKNGRHGKSIFGTGLDGLQNLRLNYQKPKKSEELEAFISLLSCA